MHININTIMWLCAIDTFSNVNARTHNNNQDNKICIASLMDRIHIYIFHITRALQKINKICCS